MKQTKIVEAIILKIDKHKEFDAKLTLFTESGIVACYATGLLKEKSKLKSILQPFNIIEATLISTKLATAHLKQNSINLTKNIKNYYLACSISHTLIELGRNIQETNDIFELTKGALLLLTSTEMESREIFILFYSKFLEFLGYGEETTVAGIKQNLKENLGYDILTK